MSGFTEVDHDAAFRCANVAHTLWTAGTARDIPGGDLVGMAASS
jgi:hypothetical protein